MGVLLLPPKQVVALLSEKSFSILILNDWIRRPDNPLSHKMSFLWSVGDKSKLPPQNEEYLTTKDNNKSEENKTKSPSPSTSSEEPKKESLQHQLLLEKSSEISSKQATTSGQQPEISSKQSTTASSSNNKPNIKRKIQDQDEDFDDFVVEKTKIAKEDDENSEISSSGNDEPDGSSLLATIVSAITPSSSIGKKSVKRTLDSPESSPSYHSDVKKSRNNEISSSFSSSNNSVQFDEKVVKNENSTSNINDPKITTTESSNTNTVKEFSEDSTTVNKKRKVLVFPKEILSPKKMLADLPSIVNNYVAKNSSNQSTDEDESAEFEISDLKAFNEDQEKSEERGKELMKAFEDDWKIIVYNFLKKEI